jgi:hypothetical protein
LDLDIDSINLNLNETIDITNKGTNNDAKNDITNGCNIDDINSSNVDRVTNSNNNFFHNNIKSKDENLHRKGLFSLLTSGNEQYTLLSLFLCHSISESTLNRICNGENKYKIAANEMKIYECLKLFDIKDNNINEVLQMNSSFINQVNKDDNGVNNKILPIISDVGVEVKGDLRVGMGLDDIHDLEDVDDLDEISNGIEYNWLNTLNVTKLIDIDNILKERNTDSIEDSLIERKDDVNETNNNNNVNNLYLTNMISLNILGNSTSHTLTTLQVGCYHLYSLVRIAHNSLRNISNFDKEGIKLNNSYISLKSYKKFALDNVRKSASIVLDRFNSLNSENILPLFTIIQEELRRLHGQKWSLNYQKMMQNPLLLIQNSVLGRRGGMEYSLPISNGEIMRKEFQAFILYLSLYNQINKLCKDLNSISSMDDLSLNICDGIFHPFSDEGLTSKTMIEGSTFDMKSRKFLDAYNFKKNANVKDQELNNVKNNSQLNQSVSSPITSDKSSSIFSFGFGGHSKSKNPIEPSISDNASAIVSRSQRNYGLSIYVNLFLSMLIYINLL